MENVMQDELEEKLPLVCETAKPWLPCFSSPFPPKLYKQYLPPRLFLH